VARKTKVGIYGGTFDPPHNAHLTVAKFALEKLTLDVLYIVPAKGHALKKNASITPAPIRYDMTKAAFRDQHRIRVSRIELDGPETSYTVDTIERFQAYEHLRDPEYYDLIGADNLSELHLWKEPEKIINIAHVVVLRRPGYLEIPEISRSWKRMIMLDSPEMDISSTDIRNRVRQGIPIDDAVPRAVIELIEFHGLYRHT
jgi:nicotinate-nucleotide adenylyltransferase